MTITHRDRDILRRLAGRYRQVCDSPRNHELRRRWYDHNDLMPGRPMVLCFPEGAWAEVPEAQVTETGDPTLHAVERSLRMRLYTAEVLRDDQAFEPWFNVAWRVAIAQPTFGVEVHKHAGAGRGSWKAEPPLKDLARDLARLRPREPSLDREATLRERERLESAFGDILPVRIRSTHWWTDGLTIEVIDLIGLERLMTAMIDEPDQLHRLMAWMRDERLAFTGWFEREGLLCTRNADDYVGSGGLGYTRQLPRPGQDGAEPPRFADCWGFAESQETVGVGPRHFAEFILPYQLPIISRYGLNCYGCCEGLERRLDHVLRIPRLRRVSVSPWADQAVCAAKLGDRIIFSRKPNPALLCGVFDEQAVREDLRRTLRIAGGCRLEFILKDTHTVDGHPERLARWVEMAHEEVDAAMAAPASGSAAAARG